MIEESLIGQTFGNLTVIEPISDFTFTEDGVTYIVKRWKCQCNCENKNIVYVTEYDLVNGRATSCNDCSDRNHISILHATNEILKKSRSLLSINNEKYNKNMGNKLYRIYRMMISKCYVKTYKAYKYYGQLGIKMDDEWRGYYGFENFVDWSYDHGYNPNLPRNECTLDRIDPRGNYSPENCRWGPMLLQANNRTNNVMYDFNGEQHTLAEISRAVGVSQPTLYNRLNNLKWPFEKAIIPPSKMIQAVYFENEYGIIIDQPEFDD